MRNELKRRLRLVEGARVEVPGNISMVVAAMPTDDLIHIDELRIVRMQDEGDDHFHRRARLALGADQLILLVPKEVPPRAY